jgi:drug/metabolite transporter (DMT)-like permease
MSRSCKVIAVWLSVVMLLGLIPTSASADMETAHKYLGFGTILLAGGTAATNGDFDTHEPLAYATAACALSTVITGYLAHGDRFDTGDGLFTQENSHMMAGTLGAIILTTGVILASGSYDDADGSVDKHAGIAMVGGALMTIAIIDIEW